ncbi:MAG: hypothetical protein KDI18_04230 [Gammaproteobacteria bacterium]|nr:hypothetical protein [Gammaproteobacteria bacterium]
MKNTLSFNKLTSVILLLGMFVWSSFSAAQSAGGMSRRLFEAQGIMRFIDLPAGIVQIDDSRYRLAPDMQWAGVDPEENLMKQLLRALNGPVAYVVDPKQHAPTVNAIWVLPPEGR